jgi:hypothetical protein
MGSSQVNEPMVQEWQRKMGFQECGIIAGIIQGGIGEVFFTKSLRAVLLGLYSDLEQRANEG